MRQNCDEMPLHAARDGERIPDSHGPGLSGGVTGSQELCTEVTQRSRGGCQRRSLGMCTLQGRGGQFRLVCSTTTKMRADDCWFPTAVKSIAIVQLGNFITL